ncbi:hypothetical protein HOF65_04085 [bacterium]|nr:hypothetical protein [bacterium]MBT4632417.1 hypothetical protein [bacterium]
MFFISSNISGKVSSIKCPLSSNIFCSEPVKIFQKSSKSEYGTTGSSFE